MSGPRQPNTASAAAAAAVALLFLLPVLPVQSDAFTLAHRRKMSFAAAKVRLPRAEGRRQAQCPCFRRSDAPPVRASLSDQQRFTLAARGGSSGNSSAGGMIEQVRSFASRNFFMLGMAFAVSLARAFPHLGKNGGFLRPEIFIGQYGVTTIFLLSGLSLQLAELTDALSNVKLNGIVQLLSFGAWPFLVGLPLTKALDMYLPNLLPKALRDGLLILTCLPTTVNMCVLLTSAAGGNVASALCNAVIGNMLGIFATPALLLRFFGKSIELPFASMVLKLCNKVLFPVAVGQALRTTPVKGVYKRNSKRFKRLQEVILLGIVWNAFCNAFTKGLGLEVRHTVALLTILPAMHIASLALLFGFLKWKPLKFTRGDAVAGMFCASHKTLAFGLPLINTIFEGNPNIAAYCAPLMFIHPLQLLLGSFLVPTFARYTRGK